MMKVTTSAPGKITLFGEHAVVYGQPALVSAIDRRLYVTVEERGDSSIKVSALDLHIPGLILTFREGSNDLLVETDYERIIDAMSYVRKAIELASKHVDKKQGVNVTIKSEMPVGAGLGTSAAIAVGTIAAYTRLMGHELKQEEIAHLGHATELEVQGAASPMDTAISTYGGTIYIKPGKPGPHIEKLKIGRKLPSVVGYTEREAKTGDLLKRVRTLREASPKVVDSIMTTIGEIVKEAKSSILKGDLESLGMLMNINHGQLESLGVSSQKLNDMVYSSRSAGAVGSKMTGAGGGGCMIALCLRETDKVAVAIKVVGGVPFEASLSGTGVRLESTDKN
jgi:mevalonate kinase